MLHFLIYFYFFCLKISSQIMCHHLISWWHISQNNKSHATTTHHLGTNFWEEKKKKKLGKCSTSRVNDKPFFFLEKNWVDFHISIKDRTYFSIIIILQIHSGVSSGQTKQVNGRPYYQFYLQKHIASLVEPWIPDACPPLYDQNGFHWQLHLTRKCRVINEQSYPLACSGSAR